jgi:hypothetical protein
MPAFPERTVVLNLFIVCARISYSLPLRTCVPSGELVEAQQFRGKLRLHIFGEDDMKADSNLQIDNWVNHFASLIRNTIALVICLPLLTVFSGDAVAQVRPPCDTSCGGTTNTTDPTLLLVRGQIPATRGNGPGVPSGGAKRIAGSSSFSYVVPLLNIPGRGIDLSLNLHYNSFVWTQSGTSLTLNADRDNPSIGFRLDYGYIEFASDGSAGIITDGTGAKRTLALANPQPNPTAGVTWTTTDSTYTQVFVANVGPVVATLKSGARIFYQSFTADTTLEYRPYRIEDTNGNIITINYMNTNNLSLMAVTDSLGRTIGFFYDSTGSMLQCVTTGASCTAPNATTYTFSWNQNYLLNFAFTRTTGTTLKSGITVLDVLSAVTRPDSTSVKFNYGDWAIVNKVQETTSTGNVRYSTAFNFPAASAGALPFNPTYTQQTVFDGVQTATWNFLATSNAAGLVTSLATTDPDSTTSTTTFSANGDWQDGLPIQTQITTPQGYTTDYLCIPIACPPPPSTWRTTKRTWTSDSSAGANPRPLTDTLILEDGSQSQVVYDTYDVNGNLTHVLQYDFGASPHGPLLRETTTVFNPLANNILNRPSDIQVKDGIGNLISHSVFRYDEGTLTSVSQSTPGHDPNFFAPQNVRGNLTTKIDYADPTHSVTSTFTYDSLGNLLTSQAGCCTATSRQFSSVTNFGYPDSVSVGPAGNQLTSTFTYDFASGAVLTSIDPNGKKTS